MIVGWEPRCCRWNSPTASCPGLVGFAFGGLIYGPFTAICTALFQRLSPPHALSRVLATGSAGARSGDRLVT
jgi:hypothetical protein